MKKLILSVLLPLLCGLLAACRKDKDPAPVVSGQVLEYGTDKPLANAKVVLYQCDSELLGSINCSEVATAYTASEGGYVIPYPEGERKATLANAFLAGYFSDIDSEISVGTKPDYDANIQLYPHAWLRVKIKNESGAYLISAPAATYTRNSRDFIIPQYQDSTFFIFRKGNQDFKYVFGILDQPNHVLNDISIIKVNNGSIKVTKDIGAFFFNIPLPGHDTTDITIIY